MGKLIKAAGAVAAVAVFAGVYSALDDGSSTVDHPAPVKASQSAVSGHAGTKASDDVKVTSCKKGDFGTLTVHGKITNHTDSPKDYMITVEAVNKSGDRLGEADGAQNAVRPGQSVSFQAVGTFDGSGTFTCQLAQVSRF